MKSLVHLFCLILISFSISCSKKEELSSASDIYKTKTETKEVYYKKAQITWQNIKLMHL